MHTDLANDIKDRLNCVHYKEYVILEDSWINEQFIYTDLPVKTDFQITGLSVNYYAELVQMSGKKGLIEKWSQLKKKKKSIDYTGY